MKPVIASIFSLLVAGFLHADCTKLSQTLGAREFWKVFTDAYGAARFPGELTVCTGRSYFFEIKGGAKMQSALDRQKGRILRRTPMLKYLIHELAHVYLDTRWRVLPYSVSEPLVLAMSDVSKCESPHGAAGGNPPLPQRWVNRKEMPRCDLLALLAEVLNAPQATRDSLPLN